MMDYMGQEGLLILIRRRGELLYRLPASFFGFFYCHPFLPSLVTSLFLPFLPCFTHVRLDCFAPPSLPPLPQALEEEGEELESPLTSPNRSKGRVSGGDRSNDANSPHDVGGNGEKHGKMAEESQHSNPTSPHGLYGVPVTITDSFYERDSERETNQTVISADDDNYCLRALQCACELREHKDSNLGTHIAVTAGT